MVISLTEKYVAAILIWMTTCIQVSYSKHRIFTRI